MKRRGIRKAVDDLSIRIYPGDVYGFLGPNGAGKTTAIRMILGLIAPDHGSVLIHGEPHPVKRLHGVGSLVETPTFFDGMTGRANLERSLAFAGCRDDGDIDKSLERVGLKERGNDKVKTYSLGMRQRLGIARALLGSPKLLILDEPTNGLDPRGMKEVRELLNGLAKDEELTILISSHILSEVEQLCNRIGILDQGKMVAEGTQAELRAELRGNRREVEVGGPDLEAIAAFVRSVDAAELTKSSHVDRVRVALNGMDISELNAKMVAGGMKVNALVPVGSSLEDSFLELTAGSKL